VVRRLRRRRERNDVDDRGLLANDHHDQYICATASLETCLAVIGRMLVDLAGTLLIQ
jgi:hypothetical protein